MSAPAGEPRRCAWAGTDPLYVEYHDREWGVPEYRDVRLFEMLILEGAQAGLSWLTILRRREGYRRAFSGFEPAKVARFDRRKIDRLLSDTRIVRNRAKIHAAVGNARVFLEIQREFDCFREFAWGFVGGRPLVHRFGSLDEVPAVSPESEAMSRELRRRGMKFVGPTICYALMQATGMVNDHTTDCFRYRELAGD